jgi:hypothetical protein
MSSSKSTDMSSIASSIASSIVSASAPSSSNARGSSVTVERLYALFNNKLADFFEDLRPVIGNLPEYMIFTSTAALVSKMRPEQNYNMFKVYIESRYRDKIINRDETFFMNNSYSELDNKYVSSPDIVSMLKHKWKDLSDSDKQAVWCHMDVLLRISELLKKKTSA